MQKDPNAIIDKPHTEKQEQSELNRETIIKNLKGIMSEKKTR